MANDRKNLEDLNELSLTLKAQLQEMADGDREWLDKPFIVGLMLKNSVHSLDQDAVFGAYYGVTVNGHVPRWLALEEVLRMRGFIHGQDRYEIGNDVYVSAVEPRTTDGVDAHAIVLEGQERDFIIVLNREDDRDWSVHIRQAWRDFTKAFETDSCSAGFKSSELTPWDIVRMAETAMRYSDDLPGVQYPSRPSLDKLLTSSLVGGGKSSPNGLDYGDFRDPGYVVSMEVDYFTKLPEVKKGSRVHAGDLSRISSHLHYAANCLVRHAG